MKKISLYFHTIKYLKPIQIYFQVVYFFKKKLGLYTLDFNLKAPNAFLHLKYETEFINLTHKNNNSFRFLNIEHTFPISIDWEYMGYGKLWQYNLAYFDYLCDHNLSKDLGLAYILDFIQKSQTLKSALEPYPTSLRLINWVRFVSKYKIENQVINNSIAQQASFLHANLEYHLLGNHLLENAFALFHAGKYLMEEHLLVKAKRIIISELN